MLNLSHDIDDTDEYYVLVDFDIEKQLERAIERRDFPTIRTLIETKGANVMARFGRHEEDIHVFALRCKVPPEVYLYLYKKFVRN